MMIENKYFTESTLKYLFESFKKVNRKSEEASKINIKLICISIKKVNFTENETQDMLNWLTKPPKWTTIRVNNCVKNGVDDALNSVQSYVNDVKNRY